LGLFARNAALFASFLGYNPAHQLLGPHVLAQLPHYMMLDDHEVFDAFANDVEYFWRPSAPVRDVALEAYRQYQHSHNPQSYPPPALYYRFEFGGVHFFALDVRSERWKRKDPDPHS